MTDTDTESDSASDPDTDSTRDPGPAFQKRPVQIRARRADPGETVETREGTLTADEGDLIITGVEGEKYPIDPVIFAKTYLPTTDPESFELFQECVPDGVLIEYEDMGGVSAVAGVGVDEAEINDSDALERAEAFAEFVRKTMELPPSGGDFL